jgi:lantibiotic modifying enzyme
MNQRISIEPLSLYTDAGLAARMHSHRLLCRTNEWWMRGVRHVSEMTHILIYYAETKRHVSFLSLVARLHSDIQIKCDSMKLLTDMKTNIKHDVESSYEFDTSRAADSVSHNVRRAQALLTKTTFIYRVRLVTSHLHEHRHMVHRI